MRYKMPRVMTLSILGLVIASCSAGERQLDEAKRVAEVPVDGRTLLNEAFTQKPITIPAGEYDWVMQPHGAQMALVWGDPKTGPSAFMVKYPPNWSKPVNIPPNVPVKMHMHTFGYHNVIISGGGKHWHEGQTEEDVPFLTSGSYFYQPGGMYHSETFNSDEPTYLFAYFEGPRDTYIDGVKVYPLD